MDYPFPKGQLLPTQFLKNGSVKLLCTSFYVENLGEAPVEFLGRTLETGDSFTVPFTGVVYEQNESVKFTGSETQSMELYILQTTSDTCNA
ncbi:hypothetical protein JJL45_09180 [Tamlana sp. s12]|uniref:hypothetical protein n=1 Tax=Tamlana sp. s12 TaxID=1630406 RepID=UPI000800AF4C|nr:hypothetical protein [Tamlana sp. s12]OBQ52872.1 hypothetical protein VQ01_13065 [Tamlana sp. s12]QQY81102.1 hypothetical protein JJL45_09180 [Tamlana sp. s12]